MIESRAVDTVSQSNMAVDNELKAWIKRPNKSSRTAASASSNTASTASRPSISKLDPPPQEKITNVSVHSLSAKHQRNSNLARDHPAVIGTHPVSRDRHDRHDGMLAQGTPREFPKRKQGSQTRLSSATGSVSSISSQQSLRPQKTIASSNISAASETPNYDVISFEQMNSNSDHVHVPLVMRYSTNTMMTKHQNRHLRKLLTKLTRDNPKIKEVALNGYTIGNENDKMAQLAMSLVGNTQVKILRLNDCAITSKGAHLLAYAIRMNRSLDHVWLDYNKIGSSGADAIASALETNQTLLTLSMSNNTIGNNGGKALLRALRQNQSITDVFVEGNRMSDRIVDGINRVCYGDESDEDDDETQESYLDTSTVTGSVVSKSFATRMLSCIQEVDYESDCGSDDGSFSSSSLSNHEPMDIDFTCCYQKKKESKMSKLKAATRIMMRRRKIEPGQ